MNSNTYIQIIGNYYNEGINAYLDVADEIPMPISFAVSDIRDLTKKTGAFSKSIVLPGTHNNNKVFNFLFDTNAYTTSTSFDVNKKVNCSVFQNGNMILDNGVLQLIDVNKTTDSATRENKITYTVLIKDTAIDLYTLIDQKKLNELDFSSLNHVYTAENAIASFGNTASSFYKYILPLTEDIEYSLLEIKPAIYAKAYMDKMFDYNSYTYSWPTETQSLFERLIMPYNGDQLKGSDKDSTIVETTGTSTYIYLNLPGSPVPILTPTVVSDPLSAFDTGTNTYNNTFTYSPGEFITYVISFDYELYLRNITTSVQSLSNITIEPSFTINNVFSFITNQVLDGPYSPGDTLISSGINMTSTLEYPQPAINEDLELKFGLFHLTTTTPSGLLDLQTNFKIITRVTQANVQIIPSGVPGYSATVDFNKYASTMLQSDFLQSLTTMFNLFAVPDKTIERRINFYHRDDYYDNGTIKDWSDKLDKGNNNSLRFLPELTSKKLILRYKQDKDPINDAYFKKTGDTYGQIQYTFANEFIKNELIKDVQFGPSPFFRTIFNAYVHAVDGLSTATNPRILIDSGATASGFFKIINFTNNGVVMPVGASTSDGYYTVGSNEYPLCTHFDNPAAPTIDINFGIAEYYLTKDQPITWNNLGSVYWRRSVAQINTGVMFTCYLDLSSKDIQDLELSDKIYLDNQYWNINQVIDYDANNIKLTKVELIRVDPLQSDY